ncbi:TetR/AcrR family transcriptional regulator [Nocardioides sp. LML1-1-1.1]|uniref:TetR/AcrR family transcriptional regulator n=1 Tax=Nocardioides sp. LML1-1-1.1 TaxID=3135248 RepID=UPI00343872AC
MTIDPTSALAPGAMPERGRRPRNRRLLILRAARKQVIDRGYDRTSMSDVASAVAVGPSALYRHFRTKQDLLQDIVDTSLVEVAEAIVRCHDADDPLEDLCAIGIEFRGFGVLWAREIRHFDEAARLDAETRMGVLVELVRGVLRAALERPVSLAEAWTATCIVASPSFHRTPLARAEAVVSLRSMVVEALDRLGRDLTSTELPPIPPSLMEPPTSRREELLRLAIDRFAEQGYAGVGMDEIGEAAGITGTSVYNHFATKSDLLVASMMRGAEWLRLDLDRAFELGGGPETVLRALVSSYIGLTVRHPGLIGILVSEVQNLPDADRARIAQEQRDYEAAWATMLRQVHGDEDAGRARLRIHATFAVANLTPRHPLLGTDGRSAVAIAADLHAVCCATLGIAGH